MSKIKLVDERNGKDFCLELDYKERCYIFTTARAVRKEDFFEAFCSDTKKIPILLQRSSMNQDFQIYLEQIDSIQGVRGSMDLELTGKVKLANGDFCLFMAYYDYDMHSGEISLVESKKTTRVEKRKIEEVNDDSAIILTDSIPTDKLFSFFMRERPELRKTEQILLHTRDKKC
ncbi:MAG: hypothetical protein HXL11_01830 [Candidatus Nanosynbacter sp.]|nr:hypothetical protein [Candidatus Nanosynbacter sp.]